MRKLILSQILKISITYLFLVILAILLLYPLCWLFLSSFKSDLEVFGTINIFPKVFHWENYVNGWKGIGQFTFGYFLWNSTQLTCLTVLATLISSTIVAYGFARFSFILKKQFFALMISTLMLPNTIIIVPRYILFRNLGWINSYLPFIIPTLFATAPFFTFLMVQFFRSLPKELDESAKMDGCNSFITLIKILIPLCKPAIFSITIFQFIWTWNDFFNCLIYINSVRKYTVSLGLRMFLDATSGSNYSGMLSMSMLSIIPCIIIYSVSQRYFVEGIATTGIKG